MAASVVDKALNQQSVHFAGGGGGAVCVCFAGLVPSCRDKYIPPQMGTASGRMAWHPPGLQTTTHRAWMPAMVLGELPLSTVLAGSASTDHSAPAICSLPQRVMVQWLGCQPGAQETWVQFPAPPQAPGVALGKSLRPITPIEMGGS